MFNIFILSLTALLSLLVWRHEVYEIFHKDYLNKVSHDRINSYITEKQKLDELKRVIQNIDNILGV